MVFVSFCLLTWQTDNNEKYAKYDDDNDIIEKETNWKGWSSLESISSVFAFVYSSLSNINICINVERFVALFLWAGDFRCIPCTGDYEEMQQYMCYF